MIVPGALAAQVLVPQGTHGGRVEKAFLPEAIRSEQRLRPIAQGAAQPGVDWHAKSHLRSINEVFRQMFRQKATENMFALAAPNFGRHGDAPRKFDNSVIEE